MMKNRFEASTPFKMLYWQTAFVFLTLLCQLTLIVVVQLLCATLCNVMDCSTPGSFNCLILIKWDLIVYLQKEYTYTNKFSVYLKEVFMFYCKSLHWSVLPVNIYIMLIYKISLFTSLPRGGYCNNNICCYYFDPYLPLHMCLLWALLQSVPQFMF